MIETGLRQTLPELIRPILAVALQPVLMHNPGSKGTRIFTLRTILWPLFDREVRNRAEGISKDTISPLVGGGAGDSCDSCRLVLILGSGVNLIWVLKGLELCYLLSD